MDTARKEVELAGLQVRRIIWDALTRKLLLIYCLPRPSETDSPLLSEFMWRLSLSQLEKIGQGHMTWKVENVYHVHISADTSELHVVVELEVEKIQGIGVDLVRTNPPNFKVFFKGG